MKQFIILTALTLAVVAFLNGQGELLPPQELPCMSQLEEVIEDAVQDAGRRRELVLLGKDIDRRELDLEGYIDEFARKLVALNALYDATRDQFDMLDVEYSGKIDAQRSRLARKIIAMQAATSKEEWERIGEALAAGAPSGFGMAPEHQLERFGKNMREKIMQTVSDKARLRRAAELTYTIEIALTGYEHTLNEAAPRVANLIRQQGATWEQFDWEFSGVAVNWTGALNRSIEVRYMLRNHINREEWKKIFAIKESWGGDDTQ